MGKKVGGHERAVVRLNDGKLLKGYLENFSPELETVVIKVAGTDKLHTLKTGEMKAVFFVKSFDGDYYYRDKKSYGNRKPIGNRIFVKFKDGERLIGFVDGRVPWQKGFFLSSRDNVEKGFFLLPADEDTNNIKVFVISSSVDDVTVVP